MGSDGLAASVLELGVTVVRGLQEIKIKAKTKIKAMRKTIFIQSTPSLIELPKNYHFVPGNNS